MASRATTCVCAKESRLSLGPPKPGSPLAPQHPVSLAGTTKGWWVAGAGHPGQKGLQPEEMAEGPPWVCSTYGTEFRWWQMWGETQKELELHMLQMWPALVLTPLY